MFAPFADARYSDFSSIRIWKYRVLPPALVERGTTVANYDSGDPAWIVYPVGKGTLHVLTTTWRPADSQLALTSKFPPLLHALLTRAAGSMGKGDPLLVGDTIPSSVPEIAEAPGLFRDGDSAFAVQIDPGESELTPLRVSDINLPLAEPDDTTALSASSTRLSNIEQEHQQKWGWWLVVAASAFFLAETFYAALAGKRLNPARP